MIRPRQWPFWARALSVAVIACVVGCFCGLAAGARSEGDGPDRLREPLRRSTPADTGATGGQPVIVQVPYRPAR